MTCKSVQGQRPMDGSRVQTVHTSADRQKTRGNKQCHTPGSRRPVGRRLCAGSGIEGKCQAKHTSMEARRRCQGVLMQPAWCFSNEDMLYTAEKTRGTQTSGGEAQTITQRIRPTEGIKHKKKKKTEPNTEDDSRQKESQTVCWGRKRLWRKCDIYKIIFAHFLTFVSPLFVFFSPASGNIPTSNFASNCPTWSVGGLKWDALHPHRMWTRHCFLKSYNQNKPHNVGAPPPRPSPNVASCRFLSTRQFIFSCLKI